jgi:3-oxoadipate enol-lactonase
VSHGEHDAEYEKGLRRRREVLGDAWVDRSLANRTPFNEDFHVLLARYVWNDVWNRPGLPEDTRRLLVIAFTVALGRWEEFDLHVRAALEHGVSPDTIKEVLLQAAVYCGVPAANTAFHRAQAIVSAPPRT